MKGHPVTDWVKPNGARNEVLDCTVYALAAYYFLQLNKWRPSQWKQLEEKIQPATQDMFAVAQNKPDQIDNTAPAAPEDNKNPLPAIAAPKPKKPTARRRPRRAGFVSGGINSGMY